MAMGRIIPLFAGFLLLSISIPSANATKKPYIIYFGAHTHGRDASPDDHNRATESHYDLLGSFLGSSREKAEDAMIYSYDKHINGFAANLEENEAVEIAKHPQVISVFESKPMKLHTTHTWDMLRLERDGRVPHDSLWTRASYGEDVIVANLDTGVWPESQSFRGDGMGVVPSRWKGFCANNTKEGVPCNRKLVGSRFYNKAAESILGKAMNATYRTPRDTMGHGTHTLSTAAGRPVPRVSIFGLANGTAAGGSPRARVASYKVCWPPVLGILDQCYEADVLAAFDQAIHDGVDVISVSLGGDPAGSFEDAIDIGAFHAVMEGIVVVCSAGNDGPDGATVTNVAPWVITVAASTVDREFDSHLSTGNGLLLKGQSLSEKKLDPRKLYPVIKSEDAALDYPTREEANFCLAESLNPKKAKGKIVVCLRGGNARLQKSETVRLAGGAGMVLANADPQLDDVTADPHQLPAIHIPYSEGVALYSYLNSTKVPIGSISPPETIYGVKPTPTMADFSSRGPNVVNPQILKPDVTAPGVAILAAKSQSPDVVEGSLDVRLPPYNLMSGTSMSCPHVAGVAGLLKSLHPKWSPAMIRSAIMTTARTRDDMGQPMKDDALKEATPFSYGSGHVHPNRAMDPGLVYDILTEDYLDFLCALGYNTTRMRLFSRAPYSCPSEPVKLEDLNYPSIAIPKLRGPTRVTRRLKNVGKPGTYRVQIEEPEGFGVSVRPSRLRFESFGEEKKFEISVGKEETKGSVGGYRFGMLIWSDGKHHVRSPIVIN